MRNIDFQFWKKIEGYDEASFDEGKEQPRAEDEEQEKKSAEKQQNNRDQSVA